MQYQQKKEEILQGVQFHNLLSFNLVENKLQRNFRHIVDALLLNQGKTDAVARQLDHYQEISQKEIDCLKLMLEELKNKFQDSQKARQSIRKFDLQENSNNEQLDQIFQKEEISKQEKQSVDQQIEGKLNSIKNLQRQSIKDFVDRNQLEKLKAQIQKVKQSMHQNDYLQNLIKQTIKDVNSLKGELLTINQKSQKASMKSFKRSSINRDILDKKQSQKNLNQNSKNALSNKENNAEIIDVNNNDSLNGQQLTQRFEKEFNSVHIQINTFKLGLQQLREMCTNLKKKQMKHSAQINDLNQLTKKMQKRETDDIDKLEKIIKGLQLQIMNINIQPQQQPKIEKDTSKNSQSQNSADNVNYKNQINDKFSKIQAMLQGCVTQAQFNRFKTQSRDKFTKFQKDHDLLKQSMDEQIRKIYQLIDSLKNSDMDLLKKQLEQIRQANQEKASQWERKHNIGLSKIEEVKKNLQNLKQDVEFYQSMNTQSNSNENKNLNQIGNDEQKPAAIMDNKELERLKKSLNNKIQDQRLYLLGLIRDLQRKQAPKGSIEQDIVSIWDRISELNLFINKKADAEDIKKNIGYLDKKLGAMASHLMKSEQGNQDARVARTNWFCLSCDKNLHSYSGKVGKHVVWDYMPNKSQGKFIKEQKRSFPNIGTAKRSS